MLRRIVRGFLALHRSVYRLTGGRIGGKFGRNRVLLLTTKGRRSGKPWTTPVFYLEDGQNLVVIASNNGRDQHPAWYLNLRQEPRVEVQVLGKRGPYQAGLAASEDRERYWRELATRYKGYESYRRKTNREFPIVVLEPLR